MINKKNSAGRKNIDNFLPYFLALATVAAAALILNAEGRIWWCKLGDHAIYINQAWNSPHTSQHLFDPYSFTHILHGVMFFWLSYLLREKLSGAWRFWLAIAAESGWELIENSSYVIEKYRANTASLDYFGDSIANSIGDILACAAGFLIAYKLGWRLSIIFFVLIETVLIFWIRDSLLINIIMLLHPFEAIKVWQMNVS